MCECGMLWSGGICTQYGYVSPCWLVCVGAGWATFLTTTSDSDIWLHPIEEEIIFGSKQASSHIPMSQQALQYTWGEPGNEGSKFELMTDLEICWVKLHINGMYVIIC